MIKTIVRGQGTLALGSGNDLLPDCERNLAVDLAVQQVPAIVDWRQHVIPQAGRYEVPLLKVLAERGGSAKPRDIYPRVAAYFPELSAEEQEQRLESSTSTRKWWNLVQWVRHAWASRVKSTVRPGACGR